MEPTLNVSQNGWLLPRLSNTVGTGQYEKLNHKSQVQPEFHQINEVRLLMQDFKLVLLVLLVDSFGHNDFRKAVSSYCPMFTIECCGKQIGALANQILFYIGK